MTKCCQFDKILFKTILSCIILKKSTIFNFRKTEDFQKWDKEIWSIFQKNYQLNQHLVSLFIDLNDFVQISCIREKRATITYLFFNALSSEVGWLKKILGLFSIAQLKPFKLLLNNERDFSSWRSQ